MRLRLCITMEPSLLLLVLRSSWCTALCTIPFLLQSSEMGWAQTPVSIRNSQLARTWRPPDPALLTGGVEIKITPLEARCTLDASVGNLTALEARFLLQKENYDRRGCQ